MMTNFEQADLLRYVASLVGAGPTYADLYYQGAIAGVEFLTYNAKKLYIAYEIEFGTAVASGVNNAYVSFYNNLDALSMNSANNGSFWDATAAGVKYVPNNYQAKNLYFSRFGCGVFSYVKFNGIKITWP